jgi:hypothetical protein
MLTTVRQKPWQKTQLWGLYKTQDGSNLESLFMGRVLIGILRIVSSGAFLL